MSLLDVSGLRIAYGDAIVVDGLSFAIEAGESVGLVGESGSGKTQTALAVLGLLPPTAAVSGSIRFVGEELLAAGERALDRFRAVRLSMVFQDPGDALNPYLRVGEQLKRVLIAHDIAAGAAADAKVLDMLDRVGLPDARRQSRSFPHQLSGGMRQRVMIASALIADPDLLIADEPTTALDVTVQAQILELLEAIREDTALLLITHDLGVVAGHCKRMLVLERGRLVDLGETGAVFAAARHPATAALIKAAPALGRGVEPVDGEPVLSVVAAAASYRARREARLHAVKSADFVVKVGETVAIVGESGSGKTTLARAVMGLKRPDSGEFRFLGAALPATIKDRPKAMLRGLQMVFQDPLGSLNPQMRVLDIVTEPLGVHEPNLDSGACRDRACDVLARVGLGADYLRRFPHELSGGQAQRIAIARALIVEPRLLVCDEALAAVDGNVREQILAVLVAMQAQTGLSILFISHDLSVVSSFSHRVLVMYLGRVVEEADSQTIFTRPRHPYTRALIDAVPVPDPQAARARPLSGDVPSILSPPSGCPFHPRCEYADARCATESPPELKIGSTTVRCHRAREIDLTIPARK